MARKSPSAGDFEAVFVENVDFPEISENQSIIGEEEINAENLENSETLSFGDISDEQETVIEKVEFSEKCESIGSGDRVSELILGSQLHDDVINSFCDVLQKVCPRTIEGLLAIQYLMICDDMSDHLTGKNEAFQVIYDFSRRHYCLIRYDPDTKVTHIYDSLQQFEDVDPVITYDVEFQIRLLLGHLHDGKVWICADQEYQNQQDTFSCGYRVIASFVDLVRGREPAEYEYNLPQILNFIRQILESPEPSWEMFENAEFAIRKKYSGKGFCYFMLHPDGEEEEEEDEDALKACEKNKEKYEKNGKKYEKPKESMMESSFDSLEPIFDDLPIVAKRQKGKIPMTATRMDFDVFNTFKKMFRGIWKNYDDVKKEFKIE